MTRIRSAAQRAPQSLEAATERAARYAEVSTEIADIEAQRAAALADTNAAADALLVPLVGELKDIAKQLKPWWEGNHEALTQGKRKSIELSGCVLGYRMSPPKVVYPAGPDEAAIGVLLGAGRHDLVRIKPALDKAAILKALEGDGATAVTALGFEARQTEQFFVDLVGSDAAKVSA